MSRPDWDEYLLGIAEAVAARSDCERSKVGAVVVKDRRVRGTGYNGAPAGKPGCDSCPRRVSEAVPGVSGYDSGPTACVAVHAEANALLHADRTDLDGAALYVTRPPCGGCTKLAEAAGIKRIVWPDGGDLDQPAELRFPEKWHLNEYYLRMEAALLPDAAVMDRTIDSLFCQRNVLG